MLLWSVPAGILLVVVVPVLVAVRRVGGEAAALRRAIAQLAELTTPLREVRADAEAVARRVPELRERARPRATSGP